MRRWICITMAALALAVTVPAGLGQPEEETRRGRRRAWAAAHEEDKGPKPGEAAPSVKLQSLDDETTVDLASFKDKRPVVLFFGSYT